MFLSRIQINPARREGRHILGSPQAMHAAVLSSFPQTGDERGRVLWRIDQDDQKFWLYTVSQSRPDFSHIVEQAGWPTTQAGWDTRPYQTLLNRLENGQKWAFRLTANPVRTSQATGWVKTGKNEGHFVYPAKADDGEKQRSKRYAHMTADQQLEWFTKRTPNWGFEIPNNSLGVPELTLIDRRTDRFQRQGKTVTIAKATFDGVLEITDADKLREAMITGMGSAKAYGCGLLTLAAIDRSNSQ